MSSGTKRMNGLMAGAARSGACVTHHHVVAGIHASTHAQKWLAWSYQPVSPVFTTDRPNPRPPERSP
jgi:hypothetical protein